MDQALLRSWSQKVGQDLNTPWPKPSMQLSIFITHGVWTDANNCEERSFIARGKKILYDLILFSYKFAIIFTLLDD